MPANLTPQYFEAEERFKQAATQTDKIAALEEMLRTIPKHKGTEKMQADLKRRLARLRKSAPAKHGTSHRPFWHIEREGIGQVLLCGPPNSGKSHLLDQLTHATPEVAPYPYTTRVPQTGMMDFEDVQIQLVDMPALAPVTFEPWQISMISQADIILLVFDVNDPEVLDHTEFILERLNERDIVVCSDSSKPRVLVLANKADLEETADNLAAWHELFEGRLRAEAFCALSAEDLRKLRKRLFQLLGVVRVYTKKPGEHPMRLSSPFVLPRGSTVLDAASSVHKDLGERFKFARIWGHARYEGQMVERTYEIEDGDIVEIHA